MYSNRILILDDEPLTAQTIKSIAEFAGMEARYTTDPETFFTLLQEWEPGYLALDLVMPEMDGIQVMVELARRDCRARLILTSGVGSRILDAAARSATEHGLAICGVLAKPFSPSRLREILGNIPRPTPEALNRSAAEQQHAFTRAELSRALENNELFVVYQPKINCRTSVLAGFEALVRWAHPNRGTVSSEHFISLAESLGLIDELTEQVMSRALNWLSQLPRTLSSMTRNSYLPSHLQTVTLSINVSALSLSNNLLFERLESYCVAAGISPERIIFELTETAAMGDPVSSLDILTRLRMKGFQLSIDDFGTGYSSMLQLARLPFSEIKIDKSFVMAINRSEESRTVAKSVVDLGYGLGLSSTAEGIEDQETLDYIREVGCDLAQGYFIARPMTEEQTINWLLDRKSSSEEERLEILHALKLLDTPPEERFDRLTRLACRLLNVPCAMFTLVDADRQWFKSAQGVQFRETPRNVSFCSHAIAQGGLLLVADAAQDHRFHDNPLVTGSQRIRFYAGFPVHASNGSSLGALSIMDTKPRTLDSTEQTLLRDLAAMLEKELHADPLMANDPLTGLLNRRGFESRAQDCLSLCQRLGIRASLLFFDLDNFKQFNRRYGRKMGDDALLVFGSLLRDTFRESDLLARFGSDEFVVLLLGSEHHTVEAALQRLRSKFDGQLSRGRQLHYSAGSSGLRLNTDDDLQSLLARADQNMYQRSH